LPPTAHIPDQARSVIGTWRSDSADAGVQNYGSVTLKFLPDGNLLYIIHGDDKDQIIRLTFRLDSNFIITDQPSKPQPERTAYEFTEDGKLVLMLGQEKSRYVRVE
jgi:hypothetical protein